jgi:hypothetical protein
MGIIIEGENNIGNDRLFLREFPDSGYHELCEIL